MSASVLIHLPTYPFLATNENHLGEFQAALHMKQQQSLISILTHVSIFLLLSSRTPPMAEANLTAPPTPHHYKLQATGFLPSWAELPAVPGISCLGMQDPAPTHCAQHSSFCQGGDEYSRLETAVQHRLSETLWFIQPHALCHRNNRIPGLTGPGSDTAKPLLFILMRNICHGSAR